MILASFNVNGIRARLPLLLGWLEENPVDVLCMQETKVQDVDFPVDQVSAAGYNVAYSGQKSYNGVAVLSRVAPGEIIYGFDDNDKKENPRLISVKIGSCWIVNAYAPQGRDVKSEFFTYKIGWFVRLKSFFQRRFSPEDHLVLAGDLNIAPTPLDVYDHDALFGSVCYHPEEHKVLSELMNWGLVDILRKHNRGKRFFTFYDYRIKNAIKRGLGWRIDHVCATKSLEEKSLAAWVDLRPRRQKRPSDHAPVLVEFDI